MTTTDPPAPTPPPAPGVEANALLRELADRLEREPVRWCVLRATGDLLAPTGDVDLLVDRSDLGRAAAVLADTGFVPLPWLGRGSHRGHVGVDDDGHWVKVDVVTRIDLGPRHELRTGLAPEVLARTDRRGDLRLPAPDDECWCLLLHALVDRGRIGPDHRERLREVAPDLDGSGPAAEMLSRLLPAGCDLEDVLAAVRTGRWVDLEVLAGPVAATAADRLPRGGPAGRLAARVGRRLPARWTAATPGVVVELVGPTDATGAVATRLSDHLAVPVVVLDRDGDTPPSRSASRAIRRRGRIVLVRSADVSSATRSAQRGWPRRDTADVHVPVADVHTPVRDVADRVWEVYRAGWRPRRG
jgi:hypothetical protein